MNGIFKSYKSKEDSDEDSSIENESEGDSLSEGKFSNDIQIGDGQIAIEKIINE